MSNKMMMCPRCWGSKVQPPSYKLTCGYCVGVGVTADVKLSKNFWLSEFLQSQTAVRLKISNDPTQEHIRRLGIVANELLEPMRAEFGAIRINSGLRRVSLNSAIGGSSTTSMHVEAWAADINPLKAKLKEVVDWAIAKKLPYDQIIFEGTWIHVGRYSPKGTVRKQALMMFPGPGGKPKYYAYNPKDPRVLAL